MLYCEVPVTINSQNRKLYGIHHKCEKSKITIIVAHGLGGTRVDVHRMVIKAARKLQEKNIAVLRADMTGCGLSEDNMVKCTIQNHMDDLRNMVDYIAKKNQNQIYLLGFSDGAIPTYYIGMENSQVKGLIFWSPNIINENNDKTLDIRLRRLYKIDSVLAMPILGHWIHKDYFKFRNNCIEQMNLNLISKKSLVIYGENDKNISREVEQINNPYIKKIKILQSNHLFFSPIWEELVIQKTIEWIENI